MVLKYLCYIDKNIKFCIKYSCKKHNCVVGGHKDDYLFMQVIIKSYFDLENVKANFTNNGKVKYKFKFNEKLFNERIEIMNKDGIVIESVKSFGRLLR